MKNHTGNKKAQYSKKNGMPATKVARGPHYTIPQEQRKVQYVAATKEPQLTNIAGLVKSTINVYS